MKRYLVTILAVLTLAVAAFAKDINTSEYTATAHVMSASEQSVGMTTYNPTGGAMIGGVRYGSTSHGRARTESTTIGVGRFVYTVDGVHKELLVGSDYPAKVDKRALLMLVDGKGRKYHITGVQEQ